MNSLRNRDSSKLSRSRSFEASPSTLSTEALDDVTCAFSVATNPSSISLSIQESEESFTSEDTEDTYDFVNVMESIKAEITGDYSHFECERHYHSDVDDEPSVSQRLDESYGSASFPLDEGSPTINVSLTPVTSKTRYSELPSREMRCLIYSTSQGSNRQDLSYSKSPPQSLSFKTRSAPAKASSLTSPLAPLTSNASRARGHTSEFDRTRTWDPSSETTPYKDAAINENSRSRWRRPDIPHETLEHSSSPSSQRKPPTGTPVQPGLFGSDTFTPSKSIAANTPNQITVPSQELLRASGCGDTPFDETDFDWGNSIQTKPKEPSPFDSPFLEDLQEPFDESPQKTPLSKVSSFQSAESSKKQSAVAQRVEQQVPRDPVDKTLSPEVHSTCLSERIPLGSTPSASLLSSFDSIDTSNLESPRQSVLSRSTSYRLKSNTPSQRALNMKRSESFTFGSKCTDMSKAPIDMADMLSPAILSFEKNYEGKQKQAMTNTRESSNEKDEQLESFLFSTPSKPMLTSEEIEVTLSDTNFSFESSAPPRLSRSQYWKENPDSCSRPSLIKKSVPFTLGSKSKRRTKERHLQSPPIQPMPPIDESTFEDSNLSTFPLVTPNKVTRKRSKPKALPPTPRTVPLKSRGLIHSQSLRSKIGLNSRSSMLKRSSSFIMVSSSPYSKVDEKSKPPSSEDIEMELQTPAPAPHHGLGRIGCNKKKAESNPIKALKSSPATVLEFPSSLNDTAESKKEPDETERRTLGKKLGNTICRVGNRVYCRSPQQDPQMFNPFDSPNLKEAMTSTPKNQGSDATVQILPITKSSEAKVERRSPIVKSKRAKMNPQRSVASSREMDTFGDRLDPHEATTPSSEAKVERRSPIVQTKREMVNPKRSVSSSRDMNTFDDTLDGLLEKVGLGSLALSARSSSPIPDQDDTSPSILDTVVNLNI